MGTGTLHGLLAAAVRSRRQAVRSPAPLIGAVPGDLVSLTFEVDFPASGTSSQRATWIDHSTFALRIADATEVHRYTAGGLAWWIDGVASIDGIHLRGEALATPGLRLEMRLKDTNQQTFSSSDPLLAEGVYGPSDFDQVVFELGGSSSLRFTFLSVAVTPGLVGVAMGGFERLARNPMDSISRRSPSRRAWRRPPPGVSGTSWSGTATPIQP